MPDGLGMGEILRFMQRLWSLDHNLQRVSRRMRSRHGVTGPQRLVLRIVGRYPEISAGEISKALRIHPSTLSGILERLEAQGKIRRGADPRDARRAVFHLAAKGRRLAALRTGTVEESLRGSLSAIPAWKLQAAMEVLELLAAGLGAKNERASCLAKPRRGRLP